MEVACVRKSTNANTFCRTNTRARVLGYVMKQCGALEQLARPLNSTFGVSSPLEWSRDLLRLLGIFPDALSQVCDRLNGRSPLPLSDGRVLDTLPTDGFLDPTPLLCHLSSLSIFTAFFFHWRSQSLTCRIDCWVIAHLVGASYPLSCF